MTMPGTNSPTDSAEARLKSFVDRVANLIQTRRKQSAEFTADIKEVVAEAKGNGFEAKYIRRAAAEKVRQSNMDKDDLDEELEYLRLYFRAAGIRVPDVEDEPLAEDE